jgi:hypothetical protein
MGLTHIKNSIDGFRRMLSITKKTFSIWWDFVWDKNIITSIVIQTDHQKHNKLDYIFKLPISHCEDSNGFIDNWIETEFNVFNDNIISGRVSLNTLMKRGIDNTIWFDAIKGNTK